MKAVNGRCLHPLSNRCINRLRGGGADVAADVKHLGIPTHMRHLFLTCLLAAFSVQGSAQSSGGKGPSGAQFSAKTQAVVVDVIVRDRRGRPVTDLNSTDFELHENGVAQNILSFTRVTGAHRAEGAVALPGAEGAKQPDVGRPSAPTAADSRPDPSFVALVFDRLSPEARHLAQRAALAFVDLETDTQSLTGVFITDGSLITLQTYTNEPEKLRAAINTAASRAMAVAERHGQAGKSSASGDVHPSTPAVASAESPGRPLHDDLVAGAIEAQGRWEMLLREQQGNASTRGLTAVAMSLGLVYGRKTIIYFAEGMALPPATERLFHQLILAANQSNVSIYTVDAAGLRVHSDQAAVGRHVTGAGLGSMEGSASSPAGGGGTSQVYDMLTRDPRVPLATLSAGTGGFLIDKTNDLASGLRRINDDRHHYYLLVYSPVNQDFKGETRRIAVKVRRRGVTVRARRDYLALPAPEGSALIRK